MIAEDIDIVDEEEQRIIDLVCTLCDAEKELQRLTGGQLDSVSSPGGKPYLLVDAQDKLRASEEAQRMNAETLTAILDALPAHIALIDFEGLILKVNRLWALSGAENSLLGSAFGVGLNYLDVCDRASGRDSEGAREAGEGIRGVLNGGIPHFELDYPCHSPEQKRWLRLTVTPVRADRRSGAVVMHVDITERRLADIEIARSHRALKMLSACNEKLVRARRENQLLLEICEVVTTIGGYRMAWVGYARDDEHSTVEPVASAGIEDGFLKEIKISWSATEPLGLGPVGFAIRTGQPQVCEDIENDPFFEPILDKMRPRGHRGTIALPLRDETRVFGILALNSAAPLDIGAEEMSLLIELADDLAFGIQHLRAIRETEEQAALLNAASDAIILRNVDDRILFWNQGAERMYGWTPTEAVGDDPRQVYVRDTAKYDQGRQLLMENGTWVGELPMKCKDGREITVDVRWTLLRDEEGSPKSVLAINTDVTERKKLEAQLMRVQRMESIGTLAGGIAHDLNNALAPILMGSSLLKQEIKFELRQQIASSIEVSAQRCADMVRQVLSFARGVEGKRIKINLAHLLNEIRDMIRDTFPKNIDFTLSCARDLWTVAGDPTQLHQVFTNLCVNARDAMPNGGALKVTAKNITLDDVYAGMNPESMPGPYVIVQVEDSGGGIPPAIQERIFEPFFTTKEVGKGTGLGLATTLGIVKGHGGFISLYSEMRKGTTFKVYIPADMTGPAAARVAVNQHELPHGQGELILLIDDEATIRTIAQKTLERYGYRVLLAINGAQAIALYAEHRNEIAVVLTDMAMPIMDGPSTIVALKALNPKVKVIGSSGIASEGGIAKAVGAGIKYFVPKPYTAEAMLKVLAEALRE